MTVTGNTGSIGFDSTIVLSKNLLNQRYHACDETDVRTHTRLGYRITYDNLDVCLVSGVV